MNPRLPSHEAEPRSRRGAAYAVATLTLLGAILLAGGRGAAQDAGPDDMKDLRIGLPAYVPGDPIERPRVQYRDSTISVNDVCAVRHARLDPERDPVYVNGRPIGFCCTPCPAVFSMNPERYLIPLGADFADPVKPSVKAVIDSSRRLRIGQDIYFFSSVRTMRRFRQDPLAYCGKLTDPVTHDRFRPAADSPHVRYRSRDYWFASDSTKARFQEAPERFAERLAGT